MSKSNIQAPLKFPQAKVSVLSPVRTFWEKATLIHVECHRNRLHETPGRLSRHWYDLAKLTDSWVGDKALKSQDVLENVLEYKKDFFNASYTNYDDCLIGQFCLVPNVEGISKLSEDFKKMQEAGLFSEMPVSFNKIITTLSDLESQINSY